MYILMYIIYTYIDICRDLIFYIEIICRDLIFYIEIQKLRYRSLFMVRFKKAKGAIRTAVKKMIDFVFFYLQPISFLCAQNVLQNQDFFLLLADLMMRTFSIYVLFPLILIGGYKGICPLHIPIWLGIVLIFSDIVIYFLSVLVRD